MPLTPKQEMRVLFGLFVQPFAAAATAFLLFPALNYGARPGGIYQSRTSADAPLSLAGAAALAAVFVVVFAALPAIDWMSRRRPLTLPASLVAGTLLGNIPAAVILLLVAVNGGGALPSGFAALAFSLLRSLAFGSCVGIVCGAAFWAIAGAPRSALRAEHSG